MTGSIATVAAEASHGKTSMNGAVSWDRLAEFCVATSAVVCSALQPFAHAAQVPSLTASRASGR